MSATVVVSKSKSKSTREYNNSLREQKSNQTRQRIIQIYVDLLVEANGQDVPMQVLSEKSQTSMRTLFRFFGDKESLYKEIDQYLTQYMGSVSENLEKMKFADYAEFSYQVFDQYEKLFKAYLYTNFGQKSRRVFRKKFNEMLVKKLLIEIEASVPKSENIEIDIKKVRFIVSLINAQLWKDINDSFDVTGKDMAHTVKWAVQTLIESAKKAR
jgi:AcrR family transcriptional regulator